MACSISASATSGALISVSPTFSFAGSCGAHRYAPMRLGFAIRTLCRDQATTPSDMLSEVPLAESQRRDAGRAPERIGEAGGRGETKREGNRLDAVLGGQQTLGHFNPGLGDMVADPA